MTMHEAAPMAGEFAPFTLDGADIPNERADPESLIALPFVREALPSYSGDPMSERRSSRTWVEQVMQYRRHALATSKLTGPAASKFECSQTRSPAALLKSIRDRFPRLEFQEALCRRIESRSAFDGCSQEGACNALLAYLDELDWFTPGVPVLARAAAALNRK
ncbi:hypothetical protein H4R18_003288 [Coemansia javaensis]|uniref:Uncharacterized protein n=1 Tax=Coemansia javaensis TaxID=2761396 RepID=A0A9W8LIT9_9FUNG|nr:hypothetical protein H4R18_003288 [Coemansia javaensis]